jgi:hypothetical protein
MQCNAMQMWCQCRCPSHIGNLERLQVANISEFMVSMEASVPGKWSGAGTPRIQRSLSFHHPLHRRLVYCQLRGRRRAPARCPSPPQRHSNRKICCIRRSTALWQAEEFTEKTYYFQIRILWMRKTSTWIIVSDEFVQETDHFAYPEVNRHQHEGPPAQ